MSGTSRNDFTQEPPHGAVGVSAAIVLLPPEPKEWLTPGRHLASRVRQRQEVRAVLERLEPDRYSVFVILDKDPEELLDSIYEAESELYALFPKTPFDVRVMCPGPDWSAEDLRRESIAHYDRPVGYGCD